MPLDTTTVLPVVDALGASLETMAFITAFPPDGPGPFPCPPDARRVTITFTGAALSATLELAAPAGFGATLAANLMACDPSDEQATSRADDALKELMNVTCGAMIASLGGTGFELGIPKVEPLDAAAWDALTGPDGAAAVLDADGHVLAARAIVK
jgi:hypothetical protein